jgi:hypothetical protein
MIGLRLRLASAVCALVVIIACGKTNSANHHEIGGSTGSGGGDSAIGGNGPGGGDNTTKMPGGNVTHGEQITIKHVGPWTLQGVEQGSETLTRLTETQLSERISTWSTDLRPSWIPGTEYVYNNSSSNHGGVVPSGGMLIDGYFVPAGTWVAQFYDLSASGVILSGDNSGTSSAFPGVMFRGCRMRGKYGAPGWFNQNGQSIGGIIWINYSDAGGDAQGAPPSNMCESIFESKGNGPNDRLYVIRSYLSVATTLVFLRNNGDAVIENYCRDVQDFGDPSKHLNGIGNSGGQSATLWLRNNIVLVQRSDSTQINDVIQMAADGGAYPGTGTNLDGSEGYTIKDNYLGGAAYVLQLGQDKSNTTPTSLKSVNVTGNKFTTSLYPKSGQSGVGYKGPMNWSVQGTWSNNVWADGANAGKTVSTDEVVPGP